MPIPLVEMGDNIFQTTGIVHISCGSPFDFPVYYLKVLLKATRDPSHVIGAKLGADLLRFTKVAQSRFIGCTNLRQVPAIERQVLGDDDFTINVG